MSTTEQRYPNNTGMTFEKVWDAIMESNKRMDRWEEERKEYVERMEKEREKERKESIEQMEKEREKERREREESLERMEKERKESLERLEKSHKRLDEQLGRFGNRLGEFMEYTVRPGLDEKFNLLGFHFDGESTNLKIRDPVTRQILTELDIILENDESVIVVEVKFNLDKDDVNHFEYQLQCYRAFRQRKNPNDTIKIFGALAGAVFPKDLQTAALSQGYYVIVPSGETIKINIPEGFEPKAF
jgi:hypothetical protein